MARAKENCRGTTPGGNGANKSAASKPASNAALGSQGIKKAFRFRAGSGALRDIRNYQASPAQSTRKLPSRHQVCQIAQQFSKSRSLPPPVAVHDDEELSEMLAGVALDRSPHQQTAPLGRKAVKVRQTLWINKQSCSTARKLHMDSSCFE